MSTLDKLVVDKIARSCVSLYEKLPKTGKPIENEWTVLSCVVLYDKTSEEIEVVSLGTGSKCVGANKMSPKGEILNDSHAEVFARRGFLLYIYDNIDKAMRKKESVFDHENGRFKLKDNIEFAFYSSQLPCGDASILPKNDEEDGFGDVVQQNKRPASDDVCEVSEKLIKITGSDDIHRTGAKCLPNSEQDAHKPGDDYHVLGQVRTKPGRGDRTLSVSCSDKMAKWIHVGIQGSLLDLLLYEPIYIKYFIFGAGVPFCQEALKRAILHRNLKENVIKMMPELYQCSVVFTDIKSDTKSRPAPGSIIWFKTANMFSEVAVQGKKLGLTKKKATCLQSSLCISKYNIYRKFMQIINNNQELKTLFCENEDIQNIPYNKMKRKSVRYLESWSEIKDKFFKIWTVKPDMWDFVVKI